MQQTIPPQGQESAVTSPTPWYVSSTGSGLSATVGGLSVAGIGQAISLFAGLIGHPVSQDSAAAFISTVVTAAGLVYAIFGILRKVYLALFTKKTA